MASLKATLSLSSTDVSSDVLSFSVSDTANVTAPLENMSRITATTTGGNSIILPNVDATRYVYIKHLGLNAAGGSSGADQVKVETADGTGGAGKLQLEATANTVQVEYAYFTRS
jgi:hypothetical protein